MRIRNKDIAEKLGVSVTTVSLAINNKPGVSEETRIKIMKMINDYNDMSVQQMAASASGKPKSILMCIHKKHGQIIDDKPFFSDLVQTIQQEAMRHSYVISLAHFLPGQNIREFKDYIKNLGVDGILILGTEMDASDFECYRDLGVPTVLLDTSFPFMNVDSVIIDNEASILRSFRYGYEKGHRDIGYLKSNVTISNFQQRYDGFMKGIQIFRLEENLHPVIELPCSIQGAYEQMKEWLATLPKDAPMPTLFLADLDYIAIGAMQALKEAGYKIPEDISMIGYDDLAICMAVDPKLTSTRVNQAALGKHAINKLISEIQEKTDYCTITEVSSELIERDSVCSPTTIFKTA